MIAVVSGEGSTDIGVCLTGTGACETPEYRPGAMALMVDMLVSPIWGYSPLATGGMHCVTENELGRLSRDAKTSLPGKKKAQETAYFFKNANALGGYAVRLGEKHGCRTMAVLFRDADGTCSTQKGLWELKVDSIRRGFLAAGYQEGVPMVPKPKSEVWLLCSLQDHPYQNCARLESISGNDSSPDSAKAQLQKALEARGKDHRDIDSLLEAGQINPAIIDMPSFNAFRQRLREVADRMIGKSQAGCQH